MLANDTGAQAVAAVMIRRCEPRRSTSTLTALSPTRPRRNSSAKIVSPYRAEGGTAPSNVATVRLIVTKTDPPLAMDDAYEDATGHGPWTVGAAGRVLANDTGTGPLQAELVTDVMSGTLSFNADGSFVYTPTVGFAGQDGFTYRAIGRRGLPTWPQSSSLPEADTNQPPPQIATEPNRFHQKVGRQHRQAGACCRGRRFRGDWRHGYGRDQLRRR